MVRSDTHRRSTYQESIGTVRTALVEGGGQLAHLATAVERELWLVAIGLMLVDVTLTVHGLHIGLQELNPAARAAIDATGVLGLYALKAGAVAVGAICWTLLPKDLGFLAPVGLAIPNAIAVSVNCVVIATVVL